MGPGPGTKRDGQGPKLADGLSSPSTLDSGAADLVAQLEKQSHDNVLGYRKGTGVGLTENGVKTREVCSWLQVPAILQELQLAASSGKPVDLRILFPDVAAGATQAEIKKFFQSYHSKTAGEMFAELETKLADVQAKGSISGFDAQAFLSEFNSLSKDNNSVLSVTDVKDLNSKSTDRNSLIATLTEAGQVAAGRKLALVVEIPSQQADALANLLTAQGMDLSKLSHVRVWAGSLDQASGGTPGKKLEELTLEEFLQRCAGSSTKRDEPRKKDSKDGRDNDPPRNDPPNGGTGAGPSPSPGGGGTPSIQEWKTAAELVPALELARDDIIKNLNAIKERRVHGDAAGLETLIQKITEHYNRRIEELRQACAKNAVTSTGAGMAEEPPALALTMSN